MQRFQDRTVNPRGTEAASAISKLRLSIRLPSHQPLIATVMEWLGFLTGVAGATVLALKQPWSGYGWLAFLASNIAWLWFAIVVKRRSILLMQLVFIITSLVGITRWLT